MEIGLEVCVVIDFNVVNDHGYLIEFSGDDSADVLRWAGLIYWIVYNRYYTR
jgi:hypothetical protein